MSRKNTSLNAKGAKDAIDATVKKYTFAPFASVAPLALKKTMLTPYPAYKDSDVPWLEKLPSDWKILRAKHIFQPIDVRSQTGQEELLTVSANHGVIPRKQATVTMFKAESYEGYKLCWPGDLAINSLWAWMRGLGFSKHHGIISL